MSNLAVFSYLIHIKKLIRAYKYLLWFKLHPTGTTALNMSIQKKITKKVVMFVFSLVFLINK